MKSSVVPIQMKSTEQSVTHHVSQCAVCRTRYVHFLSISLGKNMKAKKNYFFVVTSVTMFIRPVSSILRDNERDIFFCSARI